MTESLFGPQQIVEMLHEIASQIQRRNPGRELAFVGIRARGVPLAHRLQTILEQEYSRRTFFGILDITLYRDDLSLRSVSPVIRQTQIDFDVTDKTIVVVDDVLFTGRTVRAALDALVDFGRPESIQLAVLIDRGHRQLPIQADFVGTQVQTAFEDRVRVLLKETDGEDGVTIQRALSK